MASIPLVRNHLNVARDLQNSRGFGFHGCFLEEALTYCDEKREDRFFQGHFFVADEKTRVQESGVFYNELANSLGIAMGYGSEWRIEKGVVIFDKFPCMVLAIPAKSCGWYLVPDTPKRNSWVFSDSRFTFPIKHDIYKGNEDKPQDSTQLHILTFDERRVENLNKQFQTRYKNYDSIARGYLVLRNCVGYFISQVHKKVKSSD